MSARKKWKTRSQPGFYEKQHPSKVAAYRYVTEQRLLREAGMSRTETITVFIGEGRGWETYERLTMPPLGGQS